MTRSIPLTQTEHQQLNPSDSRYAGTLYGSTFESIALGDTLTYLGRSYRVLTIISERGSDDMIDYSCREIEGPGQYDGSGALDISDML